LSISMTTQKTTTPSSMSAPMYVEHFFGDYFMKLICWFHFMFSTMHSIWKQNTMLLFMIHNYNYMFQLTCFRTMWTNGGLHLQMGRIRHQLCLPNHLHWVKLSQPYLEGVWRWNSHSRNWDLEVLRDSRNFKVQLQGPKHLALRYYLYHWKAIEV
jgi:hypothetical protein